MATQKMAGFAEAYSVAVAGDGLFALVCDYGANHVCLLELDPATPIADKLKPPEPEIPKTREEIIAEKMEAWTEAQRLEKEQAAQREQRLRELCAARDERKARDELRTEVRGRAEFLGTWSTSSAGP